MASETVAVLVGSATLVAEIVIVNGAGGTAGAVYSAVLTAVGVIIPLAELPPGMLFTDQFTLGSGWPALEIDTANWRIALVASEMTFDGFVDTLTLMSLITVTVAVELLELSARLVAVTLTGAE
jgi:hypothetical protein